MTPWLIIAAAAGWIGHATLSRQAIRWAMRSNHPRAIEVRLRMQRKLDER